MYLKMCGQILLLILMLRIANLEAQDITDSSFESEDDINVPLNTEGKYAVVSLLKTEFLN